MKYGDKIETSFWLEDKIDTRYISEEDDFILFSQDLEEYPIWAAHRCVDTNPIECGYGSFSRYGSLICYHCGKQAPQYMQKLIRLTTS